MRQREKKGKNRVINEDGMIYKMIVNNFFSFYTKKRDNKKGTQMFCCPYRKTNNQPK